MPKPVRHRTVAAVFAALCCLTVSAAVIAQNPEPEATFKDWTVRCEPPADVGAETCYIYQNLLLKQDGQQLLYMAVGQLAKTGKPAAFITLPLGVSLPGGVSLSVDGGPAQRFRFERCEPNGCLAPLMLSDSVIRSMKAGREARVTFFDGARREVSVPVSLLGFTAGYNALAAR